MPYGTIYADCRNEVIWCVQWLDRWNERILRNRVYAGPYHAELEAELLAEKIADARELLADCREVMNLPADRWEAYVAQFAPEVTNPIGMRCSVRD